MQKNWGGGGGGGGEGIFLFSLPPALSHSSQLSMFCEHQNRLHLRLMGIKRIYILIIKINGQGVDVGYPILLIRHSGKIVSLSAIIWKLQVACKESHVP